MKKLPIKYLLLFVSCMFLELFPIKAQQKIVLKKAIEIALNNNKGLMQSNLNIEIAKTNKQQAFNEQIPEVEVKYVYDHLGNLHQFENGGLKEHTTEYKLHDSKYQLAGELKMPFFRGGKLRNEKKIAELEIEFSKINLDKASSNLKLMVISDYLKLIHLDEQIILLNKTIEEDQAVNKQIISLEKNGVVTENEVLRSDLQLSNDEMQLIELKNNVAITENHLKSILFLENNSNMIFERSIADMEIPNLSNYEEVYQIGTKRNFDLHKGEREVEIKTLEIKNQKANYYPVINLHGEYALSYPNYMFFPPENFAYRFGFIGIDATFSLSNLFTNKANVRNKKLQLERQELEHQELERNIEHSIFEGYTKLKEASEQLARAEVEVKQAEVNYKIVKNKYKNQLSLITELIDADNVLLQAQSKKITYQINEYLKYYQLQYIIGAL